MSFGASFQQAKHVGTPTWRTKKRHTQFTYLVKFTQAVFTNVRWKKIEFLNVIFREKKSQNYPKIQVAVYRRCKLRSGSLTQPCWGFKGQTPEKIIPTSRLEGKWITWNIEEREQTNYFKCKFNANLFLCV